MLKRPDGATVEQIAAATGWQHHTIRGAISGALKKKLGRSVEATRTREVGPNKTGGRAARPPTGSSNRPTGQSANDLRRRGLAPGGNLFSHSCRAPPGRLQLALLRTRLILSECRTILAGGRRVFPPHPNAASLNLQLRNWTTFLCRTGRRRSGCSRARDAHPFNLCTRYAGTGRTKPFKVRSPTRSASIRSSIAARARVLIRISPSAASSHRRDARFETGPIAA
jgi:Protein of unknown function (DUF3489)